MDGQAAPDFAWSDAFVLGHEPMDATHREFVELVGALRTAPDERLAALLAEFEAHARRHFGEEDRWMLETGFPPRECHIDEHAAVLASIVQVRELAVQGDLSEVRRLADALTGSTRRWRTGCASRPMAASRWCSGAT
jgi:hemerythrin-like metal-binding protein